MEKDMKTLAKVRGFRDLYGDTCRKMFEVYKTFQELAAQYNCSEIKTPTVEFYDLFVRAIKEGTDVVDKEVFIIENDDEKLCLAPEGTSGTVRSMINEGIFNKRVFYYSNFFRKERPQKGRFREFFSIGAEFVGRKDTAQDIDCLNLVIDFFKIFGIKYTLKINTIGTIKERTRYVEVLKQYFENNFENLSETSQYRLKNNKILRILDSKEDGNIVDNAPNILQFLEKESLESFEKIQSFLIEMNIPYEISPTLVRGLDYYNNLVFEFVGNEFEGSQNTICGGGRYDGLFGELGGQPTYAVGFGIGIDRMIDVMNCDIQKLKKIAIVDCVMNQDTFKFIKKLRGKGYAVELCIYDDKLMNKVRKNSDIFIIVKSPVDIFVEFLNESKKENYIDINSINL